MSRIELEFMPSNISNSRKHYGHLLETPKSNPIYILKNGTKLQSSINKPSYKESSNSCDKSIPINDHAMNQNPK